MSTLSQDNLPIKLKTPLGANDLVAESVECTEAVNDDFQIVIHAASEKSDIKIDELLGKGITVTIRLDDGSDRVMHGLAETAEARGTTNIEASEGKPIYHYSLTLRPWLYFLRKTRSSVIYENMSVSDILQQVFSRNSKFASGDFDISSTSGQFEYIVQD
ncbi:MAG: contractile injection system protein, VgrG/Pvc8 family, partial [Pseudomonadota bacterium]